MVVKVIPIMVALIFIVSMILIIIFKKKRTVIAMLAALMLYTLLVLIKGLPFSEFLQLIDFKTVGLIIGILVTAEVVSESGLFQFLAIKTIKLTKGNDTLLMVILCLMGVLLSSILTAVVTVIIMVRLTLAICKALDINPIPLLVSIVISMDMGGSMSMISNTPNIIVAQKAGLSFSFFFLYTTPYALITFFVLILLFKHYFRKFGEVDEIRKMIINEFDEWSLVPSRSLFYESIFLILGLVVGFLLVPDPLFVSLTIATLSIIFMKIDPDTVFDKLDWATMAFLLSMFVIVGAVDEEGLLEPVGIFLAEISGGSILMVSLLLILIVSILNGFLDEVMLALTFIPIITSLAFSGGFSNQINILWALLIITTNVGGGLSPISSPIMIFTLSQAKKDGYEIHFKEIGKIGLIATMIEIGMAALYISVRIVLGI